MLNCDQLPLALTAFANSPPSTLYFTTATGACGLLADPVNMKSIGTWPATIGEVNGASPIVGAIGGNSRTMKVVETFKVVTTGVRICKNLKDAFAFSVSCTKDPHGADGLTVPVHCQLLPLGNVPATSWPPGPNWTLMFLLISVQFEGVENEIFPRSWKVRSTVGTPAGKVMVMNSWAMRKPVANLSASDRREIRRDGMVFGVEREVESGQVLRGCTHLLGVD